MKIHRLHREQTVEHPRDEVFAFFSRPENLARITPPSLGFTILTPSPIEMKTGTLIDYTVRTLGVPVRWTTLIGVCEPPHRFVDIQLRGPYSFWHHTHTFESEGPATRIIDDIVYVLPFGVVGEIAHTLVVKRQLTRIFEYRAEVIARLFGSNPEQQIAPR